MERKQTLGESTTKAIDHTENDSTISVTDVSIGISVMLAKECLEDIEEVEDGKEYTARFLEAYNHLTEAVDIYTEHYCNK